MGIGTFILVSIVKIVLAVFVLLTAVAYTTLLERKVVAHMQNRWGPSRVGPFGIWQPLADGLKFIFKEDVTPPYRQQALVPAGADHRAGHGADFHRGDSDRPMDHAGLNPHAAADHRREHRSAHHSRNHLGRRLRRVRWPAGLRTASIRCWPACAPRRR